MQPEDLSPDNLLQLVTQLQQQVDELKAKNRQMHEQYQQPVESKPSCRHSLQSLQEVDEIIHQSGDLEQLMGEFLQATLKIFATDRAWLLYPCDPSADSWQVLMERTVPDYPGALALKTDLPMDAESRDVFQRALESRGPVIYDSRGSNPLPAGAADQFSIQAQITCAIYPRTGKPWLFGMHQCSYPRIWTAAECSLFEQIGRRLPEGFDTFLTIRRLEESERKYRSLVSNLPEVVFRCRDDEHLTMNYLSGQIEALSGYPAGDFINNQQRSFASLIHPEERQQVVEKIHRALARQQSFETEFRLQTRQGGIRWVSARGQALYSDAGELDSLDGLLIDLTAHKAAEAEISKLEQALLQSEKLLSLGTLAAGMAHEINNPLAGVLQNLQVAQNRLLSPMEPNQRAAAEAGTDLNTIFRYLEARQVASLLDSAVDSGRRAAEIVYNLLNFSRAGDLRVQENSLPQILASALALVDSSFDLESGFDFRKITIQRDYADDLPRVPCDASQLQQVFINLLGNAAQALADKLARMTAEQRTSFQPTIGLRLSSDADRALIEISDNGIGIEQDLLPRLFDPFFTTKDPGAGTGLGLSVCFFIIRKKHEGEIRIESTPGIGSCATIELPLHRPDNNL